jgi:hypothetical protein
MPEIVGNLHLHTTTSDGTETHDEVALAAIRAGLDFIIYTDHNICVEGIEGWYQAPDGSGRILRLMGQEVNDANLEPERNHLLCHLITGDLTDVAAEPQRLIDRVIEQGGLCFIAHPLERPGYSPDDIYSWVSWEVTGFTGIELWNAMTDIKWQLRTLPRGLLGAYLPNLLAWGAPFPEMLAKWDELTGAGQKVVAIGSSDVHGWSFTWGLLRRRIYAYEYLFRAVNTHLLLEESLAGDAGRARDQVYHALKAGHCFVSNDLVGPAQGFTFTAGSGQRQASMGDTLALQDEATFYVFSPHQAKLRLLQDGLPVAETYGQHLAWHTTEPGVYRVEAYRHFWGWQRGWVFTNPIYVTPA